MQDDGRKSAEEKIRIASPPRASARYVPSKD
jgi:hypothetical protein